MMSADYERQGEGRGRQVRRERDLRVQKVRNTSTDRGQSMVFTLPFTLSRLREWSNHFVPRVWSLNAVTICLLWVEINKLSNFHLLLLTLPAHHPILPPSSPISLPFLSFSLSFSPHSCVQEAALRQEVKVLSMLSPPHPEPSTPPLTHVSRLRLHSSN